MSTLGRIVVGLGFAGALIAAAATIRRGSSRSANELSDLRERVELLERDPPTRYVTVRETVGAAILPAAPGSDAATTVAVSDADSNLSERRLEERQQRLVEINETRSAACEATYGNETMDPQWSAIASDAIRTKLASEDFDGVSSVVDCRRTICKVDLKYPDEAAGLSAVKQIGSFRLWPGRTFWHLDQEKREGVAYIGRQGFELPGFNQSGMAR